MTIPDAKTVGLAFFEYLGSGDPVRAMDLLDDGATWWVAGGPPHTPIGGTYTKATLSELFGKVYAAMGTNLSMSITSTIADESCVVIEANPRGVSPTGAIYDNRNVFVIGVRAGKITSIREYYDTMHTSEVFWGTTYQRGTDGPAEE